jgi:hypothetical protein
MMAAPPLPPNAVNQHVMDAQPATAHILNGSAPSAGDFHAAGAYGGGGGGAPYMPGGLPAVNPKGYEYPRRSFRQRITEEMKLPILVSLLVFVFSLPVVNFLFAHYLPRMVQPTGQLTSVGLVLKSLAAGAAFWLMQRVVVPLFSM